MFNYTYVWHNNGVSEGRWKRINIDEVDNYKHKEANNFNCFASMQKYENPMEQEGEEFISDLYFDLDSENLEESKESAIKLVDYLVTLGLSYNNTRVWFSGSKGFHIIVDRRALGIQPSNRLDKIFKHTVRYVAYLLGEKDDESGKIYPLKTLDLRVYDKKRLLRLENSVHAKTKLYKIPLTFQELKQFTVEEIREIAKQMRHDVHLPYNPKQTLITVASNFYAQKELEALELLKAESTGSINKGNFLFEKEKFPVCVTDIMKKGWKKPGDRNQATIQLACFFKEAGYAMEETQAILKKWVDQFTSATTKYERNTKAISTNSVVSTIYENQEYKFDCGFIRSLHGVKDINSTEYERVACAGSFCQFVPQAKDKLKEAVEIKLSDAANAQHHGMWVQTKVMVAGKKQTPYIIPKKIEYVCKAKRDCKKSTCPLYVIPGGIAYRDIGTHDRESIMMAGVGDDNIKSILKSMSRIYDCKRYSVEVVEHTNMEEMLVIPMADDNEKYGDEQGGKYVLRKVYTIGSDLKLDDNKYYNIFGWVYPHPKNQEGTVIVDAAVPLQDQIEKFFITPEFTQRVQWFKPKSWGLEDIHEKVTTILDMLSYNVTHIVKRDEALLSLLLTYHSVLKFNVPWDTAPIRGWVETILVGDTGTGKSALVDKMMRYVKLGTKVNAESTSRTGLTYKMEQSSNGSWFIVWGAWPLSDKEMIWVDEACALPKEEYGLMTLARSSGILEVKRAVTAETPCRVRAILSTNAPKGRRLGDYSYGVQSLKDIFNNEDIRRFDFAVFLKSSDVSPEEYNEAFKTVENEITPELLRENILYAWSRKIDNVKFTSVAISEILDSSVRLSKIYGSAVEAPLVSPSDQRNKLARLSVALASLLHSTDATGENIVVHEAMVLYCEKFLETVYNSNGCGLHYFAKISMKEEDITEEQYKKITVFIKDNSAINGEKRYTEFLNLFSMQQYFKQTDLEAMLNLDKDDSKILINTLMKGRMIKNTSYGYCKTPRFNSYINLAFSFGHITSQDDADII